MISPEWNAMVGYGREQTCSMSWGVLSLNVGSDKTWCATTLLSIAPDCPYNYVLHDGLFLWWNHLNLTKMGKTLSDIGSRIMGSWQDLWHFCRNFGKAWKGWDPGRIFGTINYIFWRVSTRGRRLRLSYSASFFVQILLAKTVSAKTGYCDRLWFLELQNLTKPN